jgi:hypothetical protein
MVVAADLAVQPLAFATVTVYEPAVLSEILLVVAPVLQLYVVPVDEVSVTAVPGQRLVVVAGDAVIMGVAGAAFTVITWEADVPLQPKESLTVTVKVPLTESINGFADVPLLQA